jgi:hypothetical protein
MTTQDIIRGDDGRSYRRSRDGRLQEIHDPKAHAARLLKAIGIYHTITGLRITDTRRPDEPAIIVTLDETEADVVLGAVKQVLAARAG